MWIGFIFLQPRAKQVRPNNWILQRFKVSRVEKYICAFPGKSLWINDFITIKWQLSGHANIFYSAFIPISDMPLNLMNLLLLFICLFLAFLFFPSILSSSLPNLSKCSPSFWNFLLLSSNFPSSPSIFFFSSFFNYLPIFSFFSSQILNPPNFC